MTPTEILGGFLTGATSGLIAGWAMFRTKREEGKTSLDVERLHDRQALTDDQAVLLEKLNARNDKFQSDLDALTEKHFASKEEIVSLKGLVKDLEGKIADNARTMIRMQDEGLKRQQDCEETITRLQDENVTMRAQVSTVVRENVSLASALREYGGSPEEAVKQGRRKEDKKGTEI